MRWSQINSRIQDRNPPPVKRALPLLAAALLLAAPAAAADGSPAQPHRSPRIIFGQHGDTSFEFDSLGPLRRSDASTRQAYFGSGEAYSEALERLQVLLRRMTAREHLAGLELSPAQEAAREEMSPALLRALALSQRARRDAEEN